MAFGSKVTMAFQSRGRNSVGGALAACVLLVASATTLAQAPDIIDAALERPVVTRVDGELVRFGNQRLDEAERALRDGLPRPWTFAGILPLFEMAMADWLAGADSADRVERNEQRYRDAVVGHLANVLAASRDPRAALVLGRFVEESGSPPVRQGRFMRGLLDYFVDNPAYVGAPASSRASRGGGAVGSGGNMLPYLLERTQSWLVANRAQLEAEAAALNEAERLSDNAPAIPTQQALRVTIDTLIGQFQARDPQLRVVTDDGRRLRVVQYAGTITTLNGVRRSSQGGGELTLEDGVVTLRPAGMIGEPAFAVSGILELGDYERATFEIPDSSARPIPVVTLKRRTGVTK